MHIHSSDHRSAITIEPVADSSGYSAFHVVVDVDLGHGRFRAENIDLQWLNLAEFASSLAAYERDRSGVARLEGTYDSYLEWSWAGRHAVLTFALGDACVGVRTFEHCLRGAFEISDADLPACVAAVRKFAAAVSRA